MIYQFDGINRPATSSTDTDTDKFDGMQSDTLDTIGAMLER